MKKNIIENKIKKTSTLKLSLNLGIFFVVAVLLVIIITELIKTGNKEKIEPPTPGISNSIYDSQNNDYESESEMPNTFYLFNGHYAYDMTNAKAANIGNTSFYEISQFVNVGVTSISSENVEPFNVLEKDVKDAFDVETIKVLSKDKGYRNGWNVSYVQWQSEGNDAGGMGVSYIVKCDEGFFIISTFAQSTTYDYKNLIGVCIKIYDSVRVSEQWIRNNQEETPEMFVPATTMEETTQY